MSDMVLVPREPTEAMLDAFAGVPFRSLSRAKQQAELAALRDFIAAAERSPSMNDQNTSRAMPVLPMWTETHNPSDHPGKFVVRRWNIFPGAANPTDEVLIFDTRPALVEAMDWRGLVFMVRQPSDDPVIVGTWI